MSYYRLISALFAEKQQAPHLLPVLDPALGRLVCVSPFGDSPVVLCQLRLKVFVEAQSRSVVILLCVAQGLPPPRTTPSVKTKTKVKSKTMGGEAKRKIQQDVSAQVFILCMQGSNPIDAADAPRAVVLCPYPSRSFEALSTLQRHKGTQYACTPRLSSACTNSNTLLHVYSAPQGCKSPEHLSLGATHHRRLSYHIPPYKCTKDLANSKSGRCDEDKRGTP